MGILRPDCFLAMPSRIAMVSPMQVRASSTIDQSSPAISAARKPALTDNSIMIGRGLDPVSDVCSQACAAA